MVNPKPHVILLASPGMGHLIPLLELGSYLATNFGFQLTIFVVATDASTVESQLQQEYSSYKDFLDIVVLPPIDISRLVDPPAAVVSKLIQVVRHALPLIKSAISSMEVRPRALIVDLFGTEALAIADEFRMLKYVYCTTAAWYLALMVYVPHVEKNEEHDHVRLHMPLRVPGCEPVLFSDTTSAFANRDDQVLYDNIKRMSFATSKADGILVNTWEDLEPKTLGALRDPKILGQFLRTRKIYSIGPLIRLGPPVSVPTSRNEVLAWLDLLPPESVLYVSFGSGGTLSAEQLTELAWGLERSGHRFIWVVRPPTKDVTHGSLFELGKRSDDTPGYLPDGFVTRTGNVGLVVPMWAPQMDILSHPSVGGFLSHCGWNSTLESIVNGVPMIAWPLYAEQRMNATMLANHLGVAIQASNGSGSRIVERKEIEELVRKAMDKGGSEGKAMRVKAQKLKCRAKMALENGGSSFRMLSKLATEFEFWSQQ